MKAPSWMKATSSMYKPPALEAANLTTYLVKNGKDPLRWLYFCEMGSDPGPIVNPDFRVFLRRKYLTEFWGLGNKELKRRLGEIKDPDVLKETRETLVQVLRNIKPFLDHWKHDRDLQKQFARS